MYLNFIKHYIGEISKKIQKNINSKLMNCVVQSKDLIKSTFYNSNNRLHMIDYKSRQKIFDNFPDGLVSCDIESSTCHIYTDNNKTKVLKLFKNNKNTHVLYEEELRIMKRLKEIGVNNVPYLIDHNSEVDTQLGHKTTFIIMSYNGIDGIELFNENNFTIHHFDTFISQIPLIVHNFHKITNMCHGDIKLENCTYKDDEWNLIDFGMTRDVPKCHKMKRNTIRGTHPYMMIALTSDKLYNIYKSSTNVPIEIGADYYATAMAILLIYGVPYQKVELPSPCVKLNVNYIKEIAKNGEYKGYLHYRLNNFIHTFERRVLMSLVAKIVLSQIPYDTIELIWYINTHECTFVKGRAKDISQYNFTKDIGILWYDLLDVIYILRNNS